MDVVHVVGSRARRVPIIIPQQCKAVMEHLRRHMVPIPEENPFFFATATSDRHLEAYQTLRKVATDAGCKRVNLVASPRRQEYVGVVCQVWSLRMQYSGPSIVRPHMGPRKCGLILQVVLK